jgi:hypothetical protein
MNGYDRRHFLKSTLLGTSGALLSLPTLAQGASAANEPERSEKKFITRKLGKTGIEVPIVSFGVMRADNPALVKAALDPGSFSSTRPTDTNAAKTKRCLEKC